MIGFFGEEESHSAVGYSRIEVALGIVRWFNRITQYNIGIPIIQNYLYKTTVMDYSRY